MADDITKKLTSQIETADPDELLRLLNPEQYENMMQSRRLASEAKEIAQAPLREALERSRAASFKSGFKDWASGAPTTQEQTRSLYERLAKEAAKEDVVKDIDIGAFQKRMAREAALKKIGMGALKGAAKGLGIFGGIESLYGELAPEEQELAELERLKKSPK